MPERKRPRPSNTCQAGDRLKLHRHRLRADGRDYNVITLRPGTRARFSTNFFHQTWHILSDPHGARVLSRLLWGLSFQRQPDTVVIIDRRFIDPNPFDAEQGDPIALVPAHLTHLPARTTGQLSRRVPAPEAACSGTVRWHTWGLDAAMDAWRADRAESDQFLWRSANFGRAAEVARLNGVLRVRAEPSLLRSWAVHVATMNDHAYEGMAYTELEGPRWELCRSDGEVQIFHDYRRRVSVATVSRREVLSSENVPGEAAELQPLIWNHSATVRDRRFSV
ncbi:hypothetical protein [Nonomuraea recticatena]|uniref:Uncharacterized protein n=1 Tax=Nonomuraea recticatena TaxID=46178 RepID=A0ABP6F8C6_9ACTN